MFQQHFRKIKISGVGSSFARVRGGLGSLLGGFLVTLVDLLELWGGHWEALGVLWVALENFWGALGRFWDALDSFGDTLGGFRELSGGLRARNS